MAADNAEADADIQNAINIAAYGGNINRRKMNNIWNSFASGGSTHGTDFNTGISEITAGGTHE